MIAPPGLPFTASVGSVCLRSVPHPTPFESARIAVGFASEADKSRVVAWLDAGLRPGRPGRLASEYPLLFEAETSATPVTLFEAGEPAAFCVLWPSRFELARGALRAGLISLVYTDPRQRQRGFARRVVQRAMEEARSQDLGVALLWSDLEDFYAAQGFTRAGSETLLVVETAVLKRALDSSSYSADSPDSAGAPLRVDDAREADWPEILALRKQRACFVSLSNAAARLARVPDLEVRVARGDRGVMAFAMRGRGDDFEGVIHEWGGDPRAVLACCQTWLAPNAPDAGLLLLSPRAMSGVTGRLRRAGARVVANPLAWFQVASLEAFSADLAALVPGFESLALTRCTARDGSEAGFRLECRENGRSLEITASELFAWLLGDVSEGTARRAQARIAEIAPDAGRNALPLPFFVWGLESI